MKSNVKSKKFNEETTLQVNVKDAEGNPVVEKEMTEEQINFCAKVATKMFKKFSASKTKKFDAETESIDVTLPESIESADVEAIVEAANDAREAANAAAAAADEVITTVVDDDLTEAEEFCGDLKSFAAKVKAFSKKIKNFSEEEVAEVNELLNEVKDSVNEIAEEPEVAPVDEVKEFCAKFKANRKAKKFAAEDLEAVQELEAELTEAVAELAENGQAKENNGDQGHGEGADEIKEFATTCSAKITKMFGQDSISAHKAKFFSRK